MFRYGDGLGWVLRRIFGKQEGDRINDALGVLVGAIFLVVALVVHQWWFAAVAAALIALCVASLWREKKRRLSPGSEPPEPALSAADHEPLPPFPGTLDDEPK